ncbi:MAG: hypothetical protein V4695_07010 [Pseudomonadota bacterium]
MYHLDSASAFTQGSYLTDLNNRLGLESEEEITHSERLPFTVRLVQNEEDLSKAVKIRHAAYARHVPVLASKLVNPETPDTDRGVVVLLAESKVDGSPLGTMRIQTNHFQPLALEQSVELPEKLRMRRLAEATRLGITDERVGRLVKTVLFKAFYLYCCRNKIEVMVVAGRAPIDRQYERLQFEEVYPELGFIPLAHAGNMPHRVMALEVGTAEARWRESRHPLFQFVVKTHHQDIDVGPKMDFKSYDGLIGRIFPNMGRAPATVSADYSVTSM